MLRRHRSIMVSPITLLVALSTFTGLAWAQNPACAVCGDDGEVTNGSAPVVPIPPQFEGLIPPEFLDQVPEGIPVDCNLLQTVAQTGLLPEEACTLLQAAPEFKE